MKYKSLSYPAVLVAFCIFGYYQTSKKNEAASQPQHEESTYRQQGTAPKTPTSTVAGSTTPSTPSVAPSVTSTPPTKVHPVSHLSGHQLYSYLFGREFKNHTISTKDISALQERFKKPYSKNGVKHHSEASREASNRMGLLKSFAHNPSAFKNKEVRQQLSSFFEFVSADSREHLMVRRQALRSWTSLQRGANEQQSARIHRQQNKHVRSLASLSDQEIIEAALEK